MNVENNKNMVTVIKKGATKKMIAQRLATLYSNTKAGFDARKFCGILKQEEDALSIQKRLRDEWE